MFLPDLVVRSRRVVTPRGTRPAAIHIRGGRIIGIVDFDDVPQGCPLDEAADAAVLPGLVDTHVHVQGLTATTQAAAAGGITTIIAMPGDSAASGPECAVDVGVWSSVSRDNVRDLPANAFGFVCRSSSEDDLRIIMPAVRYLDAPLLVSDTSDTIRLCREFHTHTHILRLLTTDLLAALFHARAARAPLTAETCPDDLYLAANDADRERRELLWAALAGGVLQMVVSARSPLQLSLAVTWTEGRARGYTLDQLAQWISQAPARLARLDRKGAIDVGYDADLVVFDPDAELKAAVGPYRGQRLRGVVQRTYLRGTRIYENRAPFPPPCGKLLLRGSR